MENSELTICSVYYSRRNVRQIEKNCEMARLLNPRVNISWLIGNNSPRESPEYIAGENFLVVDGIRDGEVKKSAARGSVQHALALKKLFPHVKTRFLLVLDPDFYIVRPNWVQEVLEYMQAANLTFFGSVWHPRYYTKYRYFPTVHCFFADLEKISAAELDFMPLLKDIREDASGILATWLPRSVKRLILMVTFQNRRFIGDSRDTGYKIYQKFFQKKGVKYEYLQPVFRPWRDRDLLARVLYVSNWFLELFLPDRLCFTPQKRGYYSTLSFRDRGFPGAVGMGWEEYIWQGRPFGVHLRGTKRGYYNYQKRDYAVESELADNFLDEFLARSH